MILLSVLETEIGRVWSAFLLPRFLGMKKMSAQLKVRLARWPDSRCRMTRRKIGLAMSTRALYKQNGIPSRPADECPEFSIVARTVLSVMRSICWVTCLG